MKTCFFFCYRIHSDLYYKADKCFLSEPCGCLSDDDFPDASSHYKLRWCSSAELVYNFLLKFLINRVHFYRGITTVRIKIGGSNVRFCLYSGNLALKNYNCTVRSALTLNHLKRNHTLTARPYFC